MTEEAPPVPSPPSEVEQLAAHLAKVQAATSYDIRVGEDGGITVICARDRVEGAVRLLPECIRLLVSAGTFGNNKASREALRSSLSSPRGARLWLDDQGTLQLVADLRRETTDEDVWAALTDLMEAAKAWRKPSARSHRKGASGSGRSRGPGRGGEQDAAQPGLLLDLALPKNDQGSEQDRDLDVESRQSDAAPAD